MAFIVEMIHKKEGQAQPRSFALSGDSWKQLLAIARTFGWQPKGTVPADDPADCSAEYLNLFKPDYEPEEWAYCKAVTKDDASNIAVALLAAYDAFKSGKILPMPQRQPTALAENYETVGFEAISGDVGQKLLQFGLFASQGGFLFAWDD
jgi:hypothetical protein